ncbi:MAG: heme ABC exporter ATP-binding protein CcmA [Hyphomicrobiaceae bacterium]
MQLAADELAVIRGERIVFSDVSFSVSEGEALILTGPNGSGKTTLIRTIAGLIKPSAGELRLDAGDAECTIGQHCHYVGHRGAVKSSMTVLENLAFWRSFLAKDSIDRLRGRDGAALDAFGLLELSPIPAGYLSDGQKRRLGLARLLLTRRRIWLLDEPYASLDAASQGILDAVIDRHLRTGGIAVIATHQPIDVSSQRELRLGAAAVEAA